MNQQKRPLKKGLKLSQKTFVQSQSTIIPANKSKKNLSILENQQIFNSKLTNSKATNTKNVYATSTIISPKSKIQFNSPSNSKMQVKNLLNFKKNNFDQKKGLVKKQKTQSNNDEIKNQKNSKLSASQCLISQNDAEKNNEQNGSLNVDLQTSIWKESEEELKDNISNFIQSQCIIKQLKEANINKQEEIINLRKENQQLQKKLQKIKTSQDENRKMLKNRITSFNEEGQQLKSLKVKVIQLQKQIQILKLNNTSKKLNLNFQFNQFQIKVQNLKNKNTKIQKYQNQLLQCSHKQMIDQKIMTCSQDSCSEGVLSFVNNQSQYSLSQDSKKQQKFQVFFNFQLDKIKIKYDEKYSQKVETLKLTYQQNLKDIESRYNLLVEQSKQLIKEQAIEILSLQKQLDSLYEKIQNQNTNFGSSNRQHSILNTLVHDQERLKFLVQINQLKTKLQQKNQEINVIKQNNYNLQIQSKRKGAQLDIQRMKINLNTQRNSNKIQLIRIQHQQELESTKQQLKILKEKAIKLQSQCQQKEQIIKKFAKINSKKYVGRK